MSAMFTVSNYNNSAFSTLFSMCGVTNVKTSSVDTTVTHTPSHVQMKVYTAVNKKAGSLVVTYP